MPSLETNFYINTTLWVRHLPGTTPSCWAYTPLPMLMKETLGCAVSLKDDGRHNGLAPQGQSGKAGSLPSLGDLDAGTITVVYFEVCTSSYQSARPTCAAEFACRGAALSGLTTVAGYTLFVALL